MKTTAPRVSLRLAAALVLLGATNHAWAQFGGGDFNQPRQRPVVKTSAVEQPRLDPPRRLIDRPTSAGRYQIAVSAVGDRVFLVDTATGHCWSKQSDGRWRDLGSPSSQQRRPDRPLAIRLPEERVELTIIQRQSKWIPGSDEQVKIHIGDITAGQTLLSIRAADGDVILDDVSLSEGDVHDFRVGGRNYFVRVRELKNVLLGQDFAVLEVSTVHPEEGAMREREREERGREERELRERHRDEMEAQGRELRQHISELTEALRAHEREGGEGVDDLRRQLEGAHQRLRELRRATAERDDARPREMRGEEARQHEEQRREMRARIEEQMRSHMQEQMRARMEREIRAQMQREQHAREQEERARAEHERMTREREERRQREERERAKQRKQEEHEQAIQREREEREKDQQREREEQPRAK